MYDIIESDLIAIADMLEARAQIPGCMRLECFEAEDRFDHGSIATRVRLLRVLLPSVKELPPFTWESDFRACFCEVRAPYLMALTLWVGGEEDGGAAFSSWDVFESTPALARMEFVSGEEIAHHGRAAVQTLTAALRHGALQNLKSVSLDCGVHDEDVFNFMNALESSGCAKLMEVLIFNQSVLGGTGLTALLSLLYRDFFPALKELCLRIDSFNMDTGVAFDMDRIVAFVVQGLLNATHTNLRRLDLMYMGLGDQGLSFVAHLIHQGRLKQLKYLNLCVNGAVTDQGVIWLARVIDAGGLPMLETFCLRGVESIAADKATIIGMSAIAHATIKGCPQLNDLKILGYGPENENFINLVKGMLRAEGRGAKVKVFIR